MNTENVKIVVIESKFVYIGNLESFDCPFLGKSVRIKNAYCIERWGTTEGIGQLANQGKQPDTRLRFTGTITVPISKILHFIDVIENAKNSFGYVE